MSAVLLGGEHAGGDRRREHQQRADERVDDELERRFDASRFRSPAADQEVERDQHQVEERHEQREVLGEERAEHRRLGEHEEEPEQLRALPCAQVGGDRRGREQQRCQPDEEHVQTVDAELVVDPQRGDPHDVGHVRQAVGVRRVVGDVADRQAKRAQRAHERQRARQSRAARGQRRAEQAEHGGQPDEDRQRRHQACSRK